MAEKRVEKEIERQKPDIREEIDGVKCLHLAHAACTADEMWNMVMFLLRIG